MRAIIRRLAPSFLFCAATAAHAQAPSQPPTLLNWSADDGKRVAELTAKGERREGKLVVLFTPAGAVDDNEETALLERLDKGIGELRVLVGRHSWQVVGDEKIFYACGTSFTKFVVSRIGLPQTIALMPLVQTGGVLPRIEELAGKPMDALRIEWAESIGAR